MTTTVVLPVLSDVGDIVDSIASVLNNDVHPSNLCIVTHESIDGNKIAAIDAFFKSCCGEQSSEEVTAKYKMSKTVFSDISLHKITIKEKFGQHPVCYLPNEIYNNTDIFVLTSLYEGMPACILEAMKIGLPIVSSNVGGIGQFITNNKNGYLLEPRNVIGFRKKIKKLLNNAGLRLKISVNNISKFKTQYSSKQVYSKTETIYRELLK